MTNKAIQSWSQSRTSQLGTFQVAKFALTIGCLKKIMAPIGKNLSAMADICMSMKMSRKQDLNIGRLWFMEEVYEGDLQPVVSNMANLSLQGSREISEQEML